MDYTGCCNAQMRTRYGRAAPLVQAFVIVVGHALALALLLVPMVVPMLFKAWVDRGQGATPTAMIAASPAHDRPAAAGKALP